VTGEHCQFSWENQDLEFCELKKGCREGNLTASRLVDILPFLLKRGSEKAPGRARIKYESFPLKNFQGSVE